MTKKRVMIKGCNRLFDVFSKDEIKLMNKSVIYFSYRDGFTEYMCRGIFSINSQGLSISKIKYFAECDSMYNCDSENDELPVMINLCSQRELYYYFSSKTLYEKGIVNLYVRKKHIDKRYLFDLAFNRISRSSLIKRGDKNEYAKIAFYREGFVVLMYSNGEVSGNKTKNQLWNEGWRAHKI